jgi:hypothetical protein
VTWRGVVYPLLPGDQIDVGLPQQAEPASSGKHVMLPGHDVSWILLQGMATARDEALHSLEAAGFICSRSGRWLGDLVAGEAYDWFIRCEGEVDPAVIAGLLRGQVQAAPDDPTARVALLEQRISDLKADLATLEAKLRKVPDVPDARPEDGARGLEAALAQLAVLQDKLAEQPERLPPARPRDRLGDEIGLMLKGVRPDIEMLRDSLVVAVGEFTSRAALYRALGELPVEGGKPGAWKMLRSVERWWERHVSDGRDHTGRLYAKFDASARRWQVLLGWKQDQARDIAWLSRLG